MRGDSDSSAFMVFMNVTTTLTNLVLGAVAFSALFFALWFPGSTHLKQHIYLCVTGYIIMMTQSVLAMSPHSGLTRNLKHQDKRTVHLVMQIIGAILAITGSIIRIVNVNNNFTTAHGILGLIAMIMTVLSLLGGFIGLYTKPSKISKIMHSCSGTITLVAAFLCLCLGFNYVYRDVIGDLNANLSIALTVIGLVGTILSASVNNFRRLFG